MVTRINTESDGHAGFFYAAPFFAEIIEQNDVSSFLKLMVSLGKEHSAFEVMNRIKYNHKKEADEIFESGRSWLPDYYAEWDRAQTQPILSLDIKAKQLVAEFRTLLEPEPGKYAPNVFAFYNQNFDVLEPLLIEDDKIRLKTLLTNTVFKFVNPAELTLVISKTGIGSRTITTSSGIPLFGDALDVAKHLQLDVTPYRRAILSYIPFAYQSHLRTIFDLIPDPKPEEMANVLEIYKNRQSDLWLHQTAGFVEAVQQYHLAEAAPILRSFVDDPKCDRFTRQKALSVLDSLVSDASFLTDIFKKYCGSPNIEDSELAELANGFLITSHADVSAVAWRLDQIMLRKESFVRPMHTHSVGVLEEELVGGKSFARPLMLLSRPEFMSGYLSLLDQAMKIWAEGEQLHEYAMYMWDIVYAYFENLKETRSYLPLQKLESRITEIRDKDGANWLAGRMASLRRSYLDYLGKPSNVAEAIKKQNDAKIANTKKILNSQDLVQHLQEALDTDLRRWIEGEGAYDVIVGRTGGRKEYEKLVQMTLKTQIENILLKRDFQVEIVREPVLLDDKRTDFLVWYGFAGPVVIEVKLTSNRDMQGNKIVQSLSYISMQRYMTGYGPATPGIFLLINNTDAENIPAITKIFEAIPNVRVQTFNCFKSPMLAVKKVGRSKKKKAHKANKP
jgi:hypothetical protein